MTPLLADIVTGETGTADVLFLIAVILAVLSTVAAYAAAQWAKAAGPLLSAAVAAAALGWLVL
jgi:hypothetical protein